MGECLAKRLYGIRMLPELGFKLASAKGEFMLAIIIHRGFAASERLGNLQTLSPLFRAPGSLHPLKTNISECNIYG